MSETLEHQFPSTFQYGQPTDSWNKQMSKWKVDPGQAGDGGSLAAALKKKDAKPLIRIPQCHGPNLTTTASCWGQSSHEADEKLPSFCYLPGSFSIHQQLMANLEIRLEAMPSERPAFEALG